VARRDPLSESVGRKAAKDLQSAGLASKVLHFNSLLTADHWHSVCLCCHRSKEVRGAEGVPGPSPLARCGWSALRDLHAIAFSTWPIFGSL